MLKHVKTLFQYQHITNGIKDSGIKFSEIEYKEMPILPGVSYDKPNRVGKEKTAPEDVQRY